jgi:FdhE protein
VLAASGDAAREPLTFAAGLFRAQAEAAAAIAAAQPLSGALGADLARVAEALRRVLVFAAERGPAAIAEAARAQGSARDDEARLRAYWTTGHVGDARDDYLARAMLRPYVQVLAALDVQPDRPRPEGACSFCGGPPWIAARRPTDGDAAQRYLGCALCGGEWNAHRLRCPACSEGDPSMLPSFQSDRHPAVRIEACDGCRRYVKSLDLTVDGRLIPEVDDLTSIAMDLWAGERGYTRVEPGLAGV